jgi:cytosine/adenosine deaminase-related metal-dependent hydrolase
MAELDKVTLHQARWILPITRPPLEGGAVAARREKIVAVGPMKILAREFHGPMIDHGDGVILPALVNAHTHLELSGLRGGVNLNGSFVDWIRSVIREKERMDKKALQKGLRDGIERLIKNGTGLVADISNTGRSIFPLKRSRLRAVVFLEALGFNQKNNLLLLKSLLLRSKGLKRPIVTLGAHSPYTVSPHLFQKVHQWARRNYPIISVHLAESGEELEFLKDGRGPIRDLLMERGNWNTGWTPSGLSPVAYLDRMGFLNTHTLCVHCVHLSNEDIEILKKRRVRICLCPNSNRNLRVGFPPIMKLLKAGLTVALGTDSLASNEDLSIPKEMKAVSRLNPMISPEEVLKMATIDGAKALGMERVMGSIEEGKRANLIFLPAKIMSRKKVYESVVMEGFKKEVRWIS